MKALKLISKLRSKNYDEVIEAVKVDIVPFNHYKELVE